MNETRGLWRGKRTDNGEWYIGSLIRYSENDIGILPYEKFDGVVNCQIQERVDSSTLGECTGLTDKNGKLIFKGDIISEKPPMNTAAYVGYVKYDEKLTAFRIVFDNPNVLHILGSYSTSYTVIGNIHDNPELLKGGK